MMPKSSASPGQGAGVAFVPGPHSVRVVWPCCLVTTNPQWLTAGKRKGPGFFRGVDQTDSAWVRQPAAKHGESEGLSQKRKFFHLQEKSNNTPSRSVTALAVSDSRLIRGCRD